MQTAQHIEGYLSLREASHQLGRHVSCIARYVRNGNLKAEKKNALVYIKIKDFEDFKIFLSKRNRVQQKARKRVVAKCPTCKEMHTVLWDTGIPKPERIYYRYCEKCHNLHKETKAASITHEFEYAIYY